jgi:hypothetical protein
MKAKLGDTLSFNYVAPGAHDKSPVIFFLARVGKIIHGLNQHYQSPQEKYYYYLMLKNVLYNLVQTGKIDAPNFYRLYVKNRLITNSYRTYKYNFINSLAIVPNAWATMTARKVDFKRGAQRTWKYHVFNKGDYVRYVSMVHGKLSWVKGKIIGKKPPGADYTIKTDDGRIVHRHPADLRLDKDLGGSSFEIISPPSSVSTMSHDTEE